LFLEQRRHGVLTVTDTDMTRFWLTLEQAVQFVLGRLTTMHGGEIFVPRIPSMRIVHLAEAIAPECAIQCVGIRPGEKLHESLIAEDESRHTLEYDHLFTIMPEYADWGRQNGRDGKPLPPGFRYRSDTNVWWLSVEQLRTMLSDQGLQENGETSHAQYRRRATDAALWPAMVG
jgi:UDP-N-acetylglucosamine 4,6-dehydratase